MLRPYTFLDVEGCNIEQPRKIIGTDLIAYVGTVQYIRSANWPNNYPSNSFCRWRIRTWDAPYIRAKVTHLDVESCCDHLRLIEVFDTSSYRKYKRDIAFDIKRKDSSTFNTDYYASGVELYFTFSSDVETEHSGFQIEFEAVHYRGLGHKVGVIVGKVSGSLLALLCLYCCCCCCKKYM